MTITTEGCHGVKRLDLVCMHCAENCHKKEVLDNIHLFSIATVAIEMTRWPFSWRILGLPKTGIG